MCERDFASALCDFVYYAERARFVMCARDFALCCVCADLFVMCERDFASAFCDFVYCLRLVLCCECSFLLVMFIKLINFS